MTDVAEQRFGPYEIERRLGAGGMAETFVAVRRGPGQFEQRVCLKRILPGLEGEPELVRLFLEEARVAARLRHANIVQVIDFGEHEGTPYLALELVDGIDLRGLMRGMAARGEPIPTGIVSFLAHELATALAVAHGGQGGERVVHRDVSPSNVLLSTAGEVKLSDFGIARAIRDSEGTRTSVVKGKVQYMAPEYALRGQVDGRVDLFALGVVLYEVLTGVRPYQGKNDVETLQLAMAGTHVPLLERRPTTPRELADAVERLIAPRPESRFPTAEALLDALVDVAPPPTSRRILGALVQSVRATPSLATPASSASSGANRAHASGGAPASANRAASMGAAASGALEQRAGFADLATQARPPAAPAPPRERTEVVPGTLTSAGEIPPPEPSALPYATAAPTDGTRTRLPAAAIAEAPTTLLHDERGAAALEADATAAVPSGTGSSPAHAAPSSGPDEGGPAATSTPIDDRITEHDAMQAGRLAESEPARPRPRAGVAPWLVVGIPVMLGLMASVGLLVVATGADGGEAGHVVGGAHDGAPGGATASGAALGSSWTVREPNGGAPVPAETPPAAASVRADSTAPAGPSTLQAGAAAPEHARPGLAAPLSEAPSTEAARTVDERDPRPPPATERGRPSATSGAPSARSSSGQRPRTGRDATDSEAILTVVVVGGGTVLVDGRRVGPAPVTLPVTAGRHVLAIAEAPGSSTVTVEVAAGERRRVTLPLQRARPTRWTRDEGESPDAH